MSISHPDRSRRFVLKGLACGTAMLMIFPYIPVHAAGRKTLVLFFSHSGNTRKLATMIHERVGGDMLEIKTINAYPQDYDTMVKRGKQEHQDNVRPALSTKLPNLDSYDIIFLGYPIWWGTMPMAMFTLLEQYDFSGKTIVPFCTHGGSRLGHSVDDIRKLCPKTKILKGYSAFGKRVDEAKDDVEAWLHGLGNTAVK